MPRDYSLRCDDENCNRLAKKIPQSDGKNYCKNHGPDSNTEIPKSKIVKEEMPMEILPKTNEHYEKKHEELIENHINSDKISVDGVETEMEIPKIMKKKEPEQVVQPAQVAPQQKADSTLSLKLSLAELQIDHMAHSFLIEKTYQSYSALGLPQHLAHAEIERLVSPHRARVADIEAVLGQFNEKP